MHIYLMITGEDCSINTAGGLGSRLSEEIDMRPKPMVEIAENLFYVYNENLLLLGPK